MNSPGDLNNPKQAPRDDAVAVVRRLRDAGHVAYFAGGCVRDQLLGLEPKDYDIATDAPPDRVRQLFSNTQAVGAAFGVILVRQRKSVIEVATFRTDLQYRDGRRPEGVVFTTAEEDAKRRDFTINGLFFDPIENKVIDFVGGQEDLKNKILRAIGEPGHRFEEDHLRLLRAIRFAARFALTIEEKTHKAMFAQVDHLKRISPERIGEELRLMLTPTTRGDAFRLLSGFLDVIMRFLPDKAGPRAEPGSVFLALGPPLIRDRISFGLALAAMTLEYKMKRRPHIDPLDMLTPSEIQKACAALRQSLKISNEESDTMAGAMAFEHLVREAPPTVAAMKRFLAQPHSGDARLLMAAYARATTHPADAERIEQVLDRLGALSRTDFAPPPFVTGDDLTAAGLQPGPVFKRVLGAVYDAQLEDRIRSKEQALELALELAKSAQ